MKQQGIEVNIFHVGAVIGACRSLRWFTLMFLQMFVAGIFVLGWQKAGSHGLKSHWWQVNWCYHCEHTSVHKFIWMVWDRHCKRSMWLRHSHKEKLFKWGTAVSKRSAYQSTKSHWGANLRRYWIVAYAYIIICIYIYMHRYKDTYSQIANSPSRCWISRGSSWGKDWQLALSLLRNAVDELQQVGFVTSFLLDIKVFMPMILTQGGPFQLYMSGYNPHKVGL